MRNRGEESIYVGEGVKKGGREEGKKKEDERRAEKERRASRGDEAATTRFRPFVLVVHLPHMRHSPRRRSCALPLLRGCVRT